jgi:hypothetical protein
MELLRIISMILVLATHACYVSLGPPTKVDISMSLNSSFVRGLSEALSDVGVNTFILISGWYGIKSKLIKFSGFIFQILFIQVALYAIMRLLGLTNSIDINGWVDLILFKYGTFWFIKAYIVLYIFAPVLNSFAESAGKAKLKYFLISFYIVQTIYGFYINIGWFSSGYSPLSFMGLYLLARYMRLYPNKYTQASKIYYISMYLIISVVVVVCSLSMVFSFDKVGTVLFHNSSPFMVLSSVCFFLFFTKISFSSNFVNWVSASCFAAYLVHCSPFIFYPYYIDVIRYLYVNETCVMFFLNTVALISCFFVFSVLFDKFRIIVWKLVSRFSKTIML